MTKMKRCSEVDVRTYAVATITVILALAGCGKSSQRADAVGRSPSPLEKPGTGTPETSKKTDPAAKKKVAAAKPNIPFKKSPWEATFEHVVVRDDVDDGYQVFLLDRPASCDGVVKLPLSPPTILGIGRYGIGKTRTVLKLHVFGDDGEGPRVERYAMAILDAPLKGTADGSGKTVGVTIRRDDKPDPVRFEAKRCPKPVSEPADAQKQNDGCGPVRHARSADADALPRVFFRPSALLCSARADGTDVRLVLKGSESESLYGDGLSWDRTRVVWLSFAHAGVFHTDLQTKKVTKLGKLRQDTDLDVRMAGWSPDNQHVVIHVGLGGGASGKRPITKLGAHVFHIKTKKRIVKAFKGRVLGFADNDRIVLLREVDKDERSVLELWALDAAKSVPMKVDETVSHISDAVVGGSWVIYLGKDAKGGSVVGASAVDGSDHKVITRHGPGPKGGDAASSLGASKDGSRVAYYGYGAGPWLRVLGLDGKEHARIPGVVGADVYFLGNTHLVSGSNRKVLVRKIGEPHGRIIATDAIDVPPSGF